MARTNAQRSHSGSVRLNGTARDAAVSSFSANAERVAPVVSRILTSAVLEQFARERGLTGDDQSDDLRASKEETSPINDDARASETVATEAEVSETEAVCDAVPLWKRVFDCTLIAVALPLWLPVMLVIMLGIKLSSPGPIFYRQERIGYRGRRFMIFKFRTMKVNVETRVHESYFERLMHANVPMTKLDANGDPRLIRCGRFLRAAGLDELPQLFNVLRGEMSLVGPRPCTVHEFGRYLPWQRDRVNAPPGMTGYWQVNGKNKTTFNEMIEMDIFYSKNMSLRLDFWILCKTLPAVTSQVIESRMPASWTSVQAATLRKPVQTTQQ
ncbi:MAG: sugar transferase [Chthoniobacterales bacterium]